MRLFGTLLALACARGEEAKLHIQVGHADMVNSVAFSPDSRFVLTGSTDRTAALWDVATGWELQRFIGHTAGVLAVTFSRDGRLILTGGLDGTARVWDPTTGHEISLFEVSPIGITGITSVAFSPDAQQALVGSQDFTARLWDVSTGREIHRFEGHTAAVVSVAFSPDGHFVLTGSNDHSARLWDAATGREIRRFDAGGYLILSVVFSPEGRSLAIGWDDKSTVVWDVTTGGEVIRFGQKFACVAFSHDWRFIAAGIGGFGQVWDLATHRQLGTIHADLLSGIDSLAFSADSRSIVFGDMGPDRAQVRDVATGKEIRRFEGRSASVASAVFSLDGRFLATASDGAAIWDTTTGQEVHRFPQDVASSIAFSRDGKSFLLGGLDAKAVFWDIATGSSLARFTTNVGGFRFVAVSPDGHFLATPSDDGQVHLYDIATGKETERFQAPRGLILSVAFSADGKTLWAAGWSAMRAWNISSGAEVHGGEWGSKVSAAAFSRDKRRALTGGFATATLWDLPTGRVLRRFEGHSGQIMCVAFSPDERFVLTGGEDNTARIWDVATGAEVHRLEGHSGLVASVAFSHDGRFVLTGSRDSTTKLWNAANGALLATLVSFREGGWAVVDPEGRYDAPNPDHVEGLYWRVGAFGTIGLPQLRRFFYTPGLLASILRGEPLPPVKGLNQIDDLPPKVATSITGSHAKPVLEIKITDLDKAGYGPVTIWVNDRQFPAQRISQTKSSAAETLQYRMSDAHFAEGDNKIRVTVASADNLIESDPSVVMWNQGSESRGASRPSFRESKAGCEGRFYGIFVGTGTFPFAPSLHLWYPESDAKALSEAVRLGAESLCGKDRVELITLTTDADDAHQPSKDNIHRAFETVAAESTRNDLLFVYFSGHGAAPANDPHSYFYLTRDARQVNVDIADKLRESTTVSGSELVQWLENPILPDKQILILDTCAAGAASTQLTALSTRSRRVADDLKKAVDNWNRDVGTYILMGSASDRSSFESDRFRHGLLTYALLRGMKGDALLDGSRLEAGHWFESAIPAVQKYAAMIGKEQTPEKVVPSAAGGIPVGFLPEALRNQIVVPEPAPEILKLTICFEESSGDALRDPIKIASLIRSELRAMTDSGARGAPTAVTYDDNNTESSPGALTPQVRYHREGSALKVRIALVQGEAPFASMTLSLSTNDLQSAAKQIAEAMIKLATR